MNCTARRFVIGRVTRRIVVRADGALGWRGVGLNRDSIFLRDVRCQVLRDVRLENLNFTVHVPGVQSCHGLKSFGKRHSTRDPDGYGPGMALQVGQRFARWEITIHDSPRDRLDSISIVGGDGQVRHGKAAPRGLGACCSGRSRLECRVTKCRTSGRDDGGCGCRSRSSR